MTYLNNVFTSARLFAALIVVLIILIALLTAFSLFTFVHLTDVVFHLADFIDA